MARRKKSPHVQSQNSKVEETVNSKGGDSKSPSQPASRVTSSTDCKQSNASLSSPWPQIVVPLTGGVALDMTIANKLVSSAQVREKTLKIVQYCFRLGAYCIPIGPLSYFLLDFSKNVIVARRFFKFFRCLKVRFETR